MSDEENPVYDFVNDDLNDNTYSDGGSDSNNNSDSDSNSNNNNSNSNSNSKHSMSGYNKKTKISFDKIRDSIQLHFYNNQYLNKLDILTTYINGKKHIYLLCAVNTHQYINMLVYPCLLITCAMIFVGPFLEKYYWNGWFVSGINAVLTGLISALNCLDLQQKKANYITCSEEYGKLAHKIAIARLSPEYNGEGPVCRQIAKSMQKIKHIEIPSSIRQLAPILSHVDIFTTIHEIDQHLNKKILQYMEIKHKLHVVVEHMKMKSRILHFDSTNTNNNNNNNNSNSDVIQMEKLLQLKQETRQKIIDQDIYSDINNVFNDEIINAEIKENSIWIYFAWIWAKPHHANTIQHLFSNAAN